MVKRRVHAPEKPSEAVTEQPVPEAARTEAVMERKAEEESPLAGALAGVKEGASDAREAVAEFIPAVGSGLKKVVYRTCYGISYGVVYSALVVASLVPTNNIMGEGLRDGAAEAQKNFHEHEAEQAAEEAVFTSRAAEEHGTVPA